MKILVTGSRGQLGSELLVLSASCPHHNFFFYDLPDLDITVQERVEALCTNYNIDVIVNCAAYTAVDKAEIDSATAYKVNSDGPAVLAACARDRHALLLHVSTDYVFDGTSNIPYRETDPVAPLGVYGRSKWEGEERIRAIAPSYMIFRTSWLYSVFGVNFVKTMLRLGADRPELSVVVDQIGTPTWAADLAAVLVSIIDRHDRDFSYGETFHYSNEGVASWYDFAQSVMELAGVSCQITPVESAQYPQIASRPLYSVLNKSAIKKDWGINIPYWRDSLKAMLQQLGAEKVA
ncbi:MAG: dTDP-4-dehydrorhamnose reductase [Chlorobium sp.]|nr:MAG: dTDP-4-dehydrorhamnose reductase [Chlorobium sp.]